MPNQQQLLSILLNKQHELKDKQQQIYELKKKVDNIGKYTQRIKVLEEKVQKLERIIKKLENRSHYTIEVNRSRIGQGDQGSRDQKINIKQQIKEIDWKFNKLKEKKNPMNLGIKNQNLQNLINTRFKLEWVPPKPKDNYHLQSNYKNSEKKPQNYMIATVSKSGHCETERMAGIKASQSFAFNSSVKQRELNSSGYVLREKQSYRTPKSNRNYLSEVSFDSSISGIERDSLNNMAIFDEPSSFMEQKQRKKVQFEGCMDLQRYKKQRLKNSNNPSEFMKINKCYSGYSTPTSQQKPKKVTDIKISTKKEKERKENVGEQLCKKLKLKINKRK